MIHEEALKELPRSLQPFVQGWENMASAANHGAPCPAVSPFESLQGSHLGLAICHLASGHLGALGIREATTGAGRPQGGGRAGEGAAGWGLRSPLHRVPGLSGQLDVTRQSQGGFVK